MKKRIAFPLLSLVLGMVTGGLTQDFLGNKKKYTDLINKYEDMPEVGDPTKLGYASPAELPNSISYSTNPSASEVSNASVFIDPLNYGDMMSHYRGDSVKVAVIDSGCNYTHSDFQLNGECILSDKSASFLLSNDKIVTTYVKNGKTVDYSVIDDDNSVHGGHGTNVCGTIVSQINGTLTYGTAPNVELIVCKTNYNFSEIQTAINYCINIGVDIINMSIQSYVETFSYNGTTINGLGEDLPDYLEDFTTAAYNHGIFIVVAGGNYNTSKKSYPANNSHVLAVGALAKASKTEKASYSNTGSNVEVVGPGSVKVPSYSQDGAMTETQGTSFASPAVAGVAALYKQQNPDATPDEIENAIKNSASPLNNRNYFGDGAVNVDWLLTPIEKLTPSVNSVSLDINEFETISITPTPSNACKNVMFYSEDESIAEVDIETGKVVGKSAGTTNIYIESLINENVYCEVPVTVTDSTIHVNSIETKDGKSEFEISAGDTYNLANNISVLPTNATNKSVEYSLYENNGTLSVSNAGVITALKEGEEIVSVTSKDNSSVSIDLFFTVKEASATKDATFVPGGWTGGTSGTGSSMTKTVDGITVTLSKGYNSTSDFRNYGGGTITISGGIIKKVSLVYTKSEYNGETFTVISGDGSLNTNTATTTITYSSGSTDEVVFKNTSQLRVSSIIVTYVVSTPVVTNYTVSFNSNGGTGSMSNDTTNGSSYVTPACEFEKSGYTFDKWALDSETGTEYSVGDTITDISKDITLYAIWKTNSSGDGGNDGEYQYYNGNYYDPITNDQISEGGTSLITALKNLIQPKSAFGYANIWTFNEDYDKYPSDYDGTDPLTGNVYPTTNNTQKRGKMWDMYSDQTWIGSSQRCGSYSTIGDAYNREHSLPKSWFGGSDSNQPGTDPNHLFNTDGKVNGMRSNYPYGEVVSGITFDGYTFEGKKATGFGKLGKNSSSDTVFEPDDAYKGDFARAQMYMATAYYNWNLTQDTGGAYCFTYSNGVSTMKSYYINLLTKWSAEDPVSQKEIDRNNAVYNSTQKNRNPFIDHPTWANKIWGGTPYTWNGKSSDDEPVSVTGVSINKTTASITVGGSLTLIPTVTPNNASNKSVNWSSSNEKVATVSNGVVTGVSTGETTIKVITVDGSFEATCVVTVTENESVESITITRDSCSGTGGYSWYSWSSGDISGQLYYYASEKSKIQMNSSKTGKALFSSTSSGSKIKSITIKSASGTPNFTVYGSNSAYSTTNVASGTSIGSKNSSTSGVKWDFGSNDFEYFSIVLGGSAAGYISEVIIEYKASSSTTPSITSVAVSPKTLSLDLYNKKTGDLSANVVVTNGAAQTVYWSSSDSTVATVDSNGKVTALKVGSATITATSTVDSTKNDTCTVTVDDSTPTAVTGVTLDKTTASISLGNTITLVPTVTPTNAANKNVAWSSSDESVATVSDGVVTSKAVGTATITVTTVDGGFTASCTLTVTAAPVITYQLEADQETVPYMSGTNHQVSVGVKLYKYSNGVKESQVDSSTGSVDTSVLGPAKISYTYQSVTYETSVKVTNNGASTYVGTTTQGSEKTETLTSALFTATSTSYVDFANISVENGTGAIYAGNSAKDANKNIQLRSKSSNSGIVQTESGGKVTKIKINVGSGTGTINVYGKNTPYSSAADLYGDKQGTLIGSLSATGTITFTTKNQFDYIGIRSNSGAIYISSIEITCGSAGVSYPATPEDQANAWADYFIKLTGGGEFDGPCKLGTPEAKKTALQQVWGELKSEYVYMVEGSKTAFCSTDATETIAEAVQHYRYIVNTYGLEDFAEVPQVSNSNKLIPISDSEPFIIGVIAMVGLAAIGGYFVYRRRREE